MNVWRLAGEKGQKWGITDTLPNINDTRQNPWKVALDACICFSTQRGASRAPRFVLSRRSREIYTSQVHALFRQKETGFGRVLVNRSACVDFSATPRKDKKNGSAAGAALRAKQLQIFYQFTRKANYLGV
jgi:hypothetical protein